MNINKIVQSVKRPALYEPGTAQMWTDEYISKQLLNIHLNPEVDLASRKMKTIERTVDWILAQTDKKRLDILDLGCGPGLYAEKMAHKGHRVTGVDFSGESIDYAGNRAKENNLDIAYIKENYLRLELEENRFDLVILIYADFGVLRPEEWEKLLLRIHKYLKPEGLFIFDVLNDKDMEKKTGPKGWEVSEKGFWKDRPYLALSDAYLYREEKVILYQHAVMDELDNVEIYRFWTHFFSHTDLTGMLEKYAFHKLSYSEDVLPEGDIWGGDHVTFCKAYCLK